MTPFLILSIFFGYALMLFVISYFTSKKANNESFFSGNRVSPWFAVAYGMIGTSLSGVTFISIPGAVESSYFTYFVMVIGYFFGYLFIINFLLPLYYRLNLTSIYSYFNERFGFYSYKTGASFFLLSRFIGSSFRMFLVVGVLYEFVFRHFQFPYFLTVLTFILIILAYTFKAGIKTIVWTDTLQTTFMLLSLVISIWIISDHLNLTFFQLQGEIFDSQYSTFIDTEVNSPNYFLKLFFSGMFMSVVMTGMDQDMMQKNLSCRNLKDAKKNMLWLSILLIPINLIFLILGAAIYIYATAKGITLPATADHAFPFLAFNHLGVVAGVVFIIGIIAAAFSSADGAMTALTTSFSIDILEINKKKYTTQQREKIRKLVHLSVAFVTFLIILYFNSASKGSVVNELFKAAGYTYGPILGLFSFGMFTKIKINDKLVIPVLVSAPILSYVLNLYSKELFGGYVFGFEILIVNGFLSFMGLLLISKRN